MEVRDFNGEGRWSAAQIVARYHDYAGELGVAAPRDVRPDVSESGACRWVYPVMDRIIDGIEAQDVACAQIGVEFLEEDRGFVFGAILKSNTARALRRCRVLTEEQTDRIRRRIVRLYATGIVPREFAQYLKLIRRLGVGPYWQEILAAEPRNHFASRARRFFETRFDRDGCPLPDQRQQDPREQ
ncbi:MAG: hypothetical protein KDE27_32900 [Planctomycetes bacterium]|nr:hypothetical protein [Planctomycetota bacterium]